MKKLTTTLQPPQLLNHKDLARMKECRYITTPDFDAYWDHSEASVCYENDDDTFCIGEVYRDHETALWTFNGKGPGGENLTTGKSPKEAILAAVHLWENELIEQGTGPTPGPAVLARISALHHQWKAQSDLPDKERSMQDHEYLGELGLILKSAE